MSKKSRLPVSWSGSLGVSRIRTTRPARKPTHAAYPLFPRPARKLWRRLHRPGLPTLRSAPDRLGSVLPPSLHHRVHLHRRAGRPRTLVPLPPLLLPLRLVAGRPLPSPRSPASQTPLPPRPAAAGWRRHAVPQTRPGLVWSRHAPRPLALQQGLESLLLGPRLGRARPAPPPARLGPH